MSLEMERLQIESRISILQKERTAREFEVDMYIQQIRKEASPLLKPLEIGIATLDIALQGLKDAVGRIQQIDQEIRKFQNLL